MTKKDFQLIATSLRNSKVLIDEASTDTGYADTRNDAWDTVCENMADMLRRTNSAFDRKHFLLACCDTVADRNRLDAGGLR